jgi:FeS assembly SUF system protein
MDKAEATMTPSTAADLEARIVEALKTVYDPEIPVDIYELGLIYDVSIDASAHVKVQMTLTSPNCPVAESLPGDVERTVRGVEGVDDAKVEIVWDPTWNPAMMSEAAKLELGFF